MIVEVVHRVIQVAEDRVETIEIVIFILMILAVGGAAMYYLEDENKHGG
jgi:hypothetical protein